MDSACRCFARFEQHAAQSSAALSSAIRTSENLHDVVVIPLVVVLMGALEDVFSRRHVFAAGAAVVTGVELNLDDQVVLVLGDDWLLATSTGCADRHVGLLQYVA